MKQSLVTLALLVAPGLAAGQWTSPDTPPDSPLWWPVLDGITAEELRLGHQRDAVRAHYAAAVEAGRAPDCGPDYVPDQFADSQANPELVPLWWLLNGTVVHPWEWHLASGDAAAEPAGQPDQEVALRESGMSERGIATVRHFAEEAAREINRRKAEPMDQDDGPLKEVMLRYIEGISDPAVEALAAASQAGDALSPAEQDRLKGLGALDDFVVGRGDAAALSELIGGSHADWLEAVELMKVKPEEEVMARLLPGLREELSAGDWRALRGWLAASSAIVNGSTSGGYSMLDCPAGTLPDLLLR